MKKNDVKCNESGARPRHAGIHAAKVLLLTCVILTASPAPAMDLPPPRYALEVSRSRNELVVKDGDQIIRRYRASIGRGGLGVKRQRGDDTTPVGAYHIVDFKSDSRFHFFMLLDYPNLVDGWHGYRMQTIDAAEFKAIAAAYRERATPPQNTGLGGYIGIHGIGDVSAKKLDIHRSQNWTRGCIALRNEEINELREYVTRGTRVTIRE
ncbi:MAG: L,D-transpeptidase [Gammaproteobacteria bacterium]|nr:L,D-transpeptidase [Gammaproteobacteria bacterium]